MARRLGLIDRQVELALHTLRRVRNAFAHSTTQASLSEACHHQPLAECYRQARCNPLWDPLERILDDQLRSNTGSAVIEAGEFIAQQGLQLAAVGGHHRHHRRKALGARWPERRISQGGGHLTDHRLGH